MLSNAAYNVLKKIVTIGLPGIATLYFALSAIWHFPKPEEVVGTISAVITFLGGLLHISTASYNNSDSKYVGDLVLEEHPEDSSKKMLVAHLSEEPSSILGKSEATFKVNGDS